VLSDTTVCKAPGTNDALTYPLSLPHVSGGALPAQEPPTPKNLCEGPAVGTNPYPVDENGSLRGPYGAGEIPAIQTAAHAGRVNEGQTVLTNGKNVGGRAGSPVNPEELEAGAAVKVVHPGQGLRLQILNAATTRYFRLILTSPEGNPIPLVRVGGEGGLLNEAVTEGGTKGTWVTKYTAGEILLPPGSRADVVAAIPNAPNKGVLTLWTEDYERTGKAYSDLPTVPVMHLALAGPTVSPPYTISAGTELRSATGDPVETLPAPEPGEELLNPATFTPPKLGLPNKVIKFTQKAQTELGVDEVFGTHDVEGDYGNAPHLGSSRYVKSGDTVELEITNVTGANHPFHLHGMSIQPKSLTNGAQTFTWPYPEFRDNVDIPGGFTLKFRVRIDPRPLADGVTPGGEYGRWLLHCHIFFHATDGMLSELVVTGPEGNERPNVNVDNSEPVVNPGEAVSVTGTYNDPDEDPVSLSASQGSVINRGGGQYTWNFKTGATEGSHLVYITATDSHGLKGQIPLFLKINAVNNPPGNQKPVLKGLRVIPKKFAPAKAATKLKRADAGKRKKGGAKISFHISEAAKVQFTIKRLTPRRPKVKVPTFSRRERSGGKKTVKFTGRFKRTGALKPGKYKLTARATDSGGLKSNRLSTTFKIVR
jgi:FtsP/CotA-like multicopper oxidase with cupredoxin domain